MTGIEGGREGRPLAPKQAEVFSFTDPSAHNFSNVDVNVSILGSSSSSVHSLTISHRSFISCSNPWMLFSCTRPSTITSSLQERISFKPTIIHHHGQKVRKKHIEAGDWTHLKMKHTLQFPQTLVHE